MTVLIVKFYIFVPNQWHLILLIYPEKRLILMQYLFISLIYIYLTINFFIFKLEKHEQKNS